MSHCIQVTLKDGSVVSANVPNGVTDLPIEDAQALEDWVSYIKALNAKRKNHGKNKVPKTKKIK